MFAKKDQPQADCLLFTIFDTKAGTYRYPVIAKDEAEITRQLQSNFINPATQYDQYVTHAEDFQLFRIGSYNQMTGEITAHRPMHVANLHELRPVSGPRALSAT